MEGLADRTNKHEVLTTANISLSWWGCCCCWLAVATTVTCSAYRSSCSSSSFSPSSSFSSFLFLPSPVGNTQQGRPISFCWCLGRGVIWWAGAGWGRVRLLCGRVGSLLLRNHQFSQFCVIKILALPYFQHTYLPTYGHNLLKSRLASD